MYMCYAPDGRPICGGLSVNYAGKTAHVYGCSSDEHELRKLRATYLLQWEMMRWALSTGCRIYDMQGVAIRPEDSPQLYNVLGFKQNFTGEIVTPPGIPGGLQRRGQRRDGRRAAAAQQAAPSLSADLVSHLCGPDARQY